MALISDHPTAALSFRDAAWPAETAGNPRFATRWLTHEDAAGPQRNAWRELAANASEPNPFYEDHLLLPALQHLSGKSDIRLLAIEDRLEPGRLIAFLPVKVSHTCRGLPLPTATAWRSIHTFLATPLIRKGCEWDGMRAIVRSPPGRPQAHPYAAYGRGRTRGGSLVGPDQHELPRSRYLPQFRARLAQERS